MVWHINGLFFIRQSKECIFWCCFIFTVSSFPKVIPHICIKIMSSNCQNHVNFYTPTSALLLSGFFSSLWCRDEKPWLGKVKVTPRSHCCCCSWCQSWSTDLLCNHPFWFYFVGRNIVQYRCWYLTSTRDSATYQSSVCNIPSVSPGNETEAPARR